MDRNPLVHRVFLLPRRRLHLVEARAYDDADLIAAKASRAAATVHRGVAAAQHDDALADRARVPERHRRQPVDADMDVGCRLAPARNIEIAPARCAAADEHGIPLLGGIVGEQLRERVDARAAAKFDAHVEDVAHLLVDDAIGQPKLRDLRAHHAARLRIGVEHDAFVAKRQQVAGDGERRGTGADQRNPLAVRVPSGLRQPRADILLVIRRDALQAANGHRLRRSTRLAMLARAFLDAPAPARRLAGPVAGAPENAREDVRLPVDEIGVAVTAGGDQPDVFGNGGVGRTCPLTIDDFVEIVGMLDVRRFHWDQSCKYFGEGRWDQTASISAKGRPDRESRGRNTCSSDPSSDPIGCHSLPDATPARRARTAPVTQAFERRRYFATRPRNSRGCCAAWLR